MKQHTVPQNIMSVEFKIFGDLSIRQFIYISVAGGLAFIFYLIYLPGIVKWPLIVLSVLIGILITFAKVNERPFDVWINNFITAILYPTQRVWQKEIQIPGYLQVQDEPQKASTKKVAPKPGGYQSVISYIHSRSLPTDDVYKSNTKLDIEEIKMLTTIDKALQSAFTPQPAAVSSAPVQAPPGTIQSAVTDATPPPVPVIDDNRAATPPRFDPMALQNTSNNDNNMQVNTPNSALDNTGNNDIVKDDNTDIPAKMDDQNIANNTKIQDSASDIFTIEPNTIVRLDELKNLSDTGANDTVPVSEPQVTTIPDAPAVTTDMPSVEPDSMMEPEVLLPPEEEKKEEPILASEPIVQVEPDTAPIANADNVQTTPVDLTQVGQEDVVQTPDTPTVIPSADTVPEIPEAQVDEVQEKLRKLEEENKKLQEQLSHLQEKEQEPSISVPASASSPHIEQLPPENPPVLDGEESIEDKNKLFGHMPDFIRYPNIISGVVVDSNEKFVEDVVVIIKDKSKRIMRAMKTNILGQFYSRNPLINGEYDVEANKEGYIFESINIQLKGEVIDPILIHPKKFETKIESGVNFTLFDKNS